MSALLCPSFRRRVIRCGPLPSRAIPLSPAAPLVYVSSINTPPSSSAYSRGHLFMPASRPRLRVAPSPSRSCARERAPEPRPAPGPEISGAVSYPARGGGGASIRASKRMLARFQVRVKLVEADNGIAAGPARYTALPGTRRAALVRACPRAVGALCRDGTSGPDQRGQGSQACSPEQDGRCAVEPSPLTNISV